jgi:hypothetical protein
MGVGIYHIRVGVLMGVGVGVVVVMVVMTLLCLKGQTEFTDFTIHLHLSCVGF